MNHGVTQVGPGAPRRLTGLTMCRSLRTILWLTSLCLMGVSILLLAVVPDLRSWLDGYLKVLQLMPGIIGLGIVLILFETGSERQGRAVDATFGRVHRLRGRILRRLWGERQGW